MPPLVTMKTRSHSHTSEGNWPEEIVENLIDAVVVMDRDGIVRYINPAACKLTGHSAVAAPGNPVSAAFVFLDRKEHTLLDLPTAAFFEDRPRTEAPSIIFNKVLFTPPKQREIIVNAVFTPVRKKDGSITCIVIRFRDVTQAVQADRKERDRQKIEAISTMAGSIASEFTNWLALISGHAAAITDTLIPRTRAYEEAINILEATKKASGLTKRLLSVARTSNGESVANLKPIPLDAVIRNAVNQAQTIFGRSEVTFKVKHAADMPMVLADRTQLLDCFMNLFRNAFDAMPDGGVITVDYPASRTPLLNRQYIIIRIRDTGNGMEKSVLEHAFDPFYSTSDPSSAIGLGLTVVQTSVEQWGGMVKLRSRPGRGTSIRLFLQAARAETAKAKQGTPPPSAEILVVDDQESFLDDLCVMLESAGYRVRRAGSAEECLSIYRRHADEIDLAIIDVVMPDKDGKNVLDDILSINPQAAVIMTSGFSRDYVRNYLKRGAWGFVQKPVDPDYLLSTVQRMLQQE